MAIDKKLICFKTQANFKARLDAGDIHDYSIVFIQDTQQIWTHGVYFSSLKEVRDALASRQETLPEGEIGQVLTLTEDGVQWADIPSPDLEDYVTQDDLSERTDAFAVYLISKETYELVPGTAEEKQKMLESNKTFIASVRNSAQFALSDMSFPTPKAVLWTLLSGKASIVGTLIGYNLTGYSLTFATKLGNVIVALDTETGYVTNLVNINPGSISDELISKLEAYTDYCYLYNNSNIANVRLSTSGLYEISYLPDVGSTVLLSLLDTTTKSVSGISPNPMGDNTFKGQFASKVYLVGATGNSNYLKSNLAALKYNGQNFGKDRPTSDIVLASQSNPTVHDGICTSRRADSFYFKSPFGTNIGPVKIDPQTGAVTNLATLILVSATTSPATAAANLAIFDQIEKEGQLVVCVNTASYPVWSMTKILYRATSTDPYVEAIRVIAKSDSLDLVNEYIFEKGTGSYIRGSSNIGYSPFKIDDYSSDDLKKMLAAPDIDLSSYVTKSEAANTYQEKLPHGLSEQILTKTGTGVNWKHISDLGHYVTHEDLLNELYEVATIDLGLPSGLLWATCNLGAKKETDYGLYFQWGDTKGYKWGCSEALSDGNDNAHYFGWSRYKHCNGSSTTLTKYCSSSDYGVVDNKTVLEAEDDAATAILGSQWRMPTPAEFQELVDNTEPGDGANQDGWIKNYNGSGVNGILLKSKVNGNTIFFPAASQHNSGAIVNIGNLAYYWTNSLNDSGTVQSLTLAGGEFSLLPNDWAYRAQGLPVRGVTSIGSQPKFQPRLPEGEPGQVLTKTESGVEWKDSQDTDAFIVYLGEGNDDDGVSTGGIDNPQEEINKIIDSCQSGAPHLVLDYGGMTMYPEVITPLDDSTIALTGRSIMSYIDEDRRDEHIYYDLYITLSKNKGESRYYIVGTFVQGDGILKVDFDKIFTSKVTQGTYNSIKNAIRQRTPVFIVTEDTSMPAQASYSDGNISLVFNYGRGIHLTVINQDLSAVSEETGYIQSPKEEGTVGQVLTKTGDGVEWKYVPSNECEELTTKELLKIMQEPIPTLPDIL